MQVGQFDIELAIVETSWIALGVKSHARLLLVYNNLLLSLVLLVDLCAYIIDASIHDISVRGFVVGVSIVEDLTGRVDNYRGSGNVSIVVHPLHTHYGDEWAPDLELGELGLRLGPLLDLEHPFCLLVLTLRYHFLFTMERDNLLQGEAGANFVA